MEDPQIKKLRSLIREVMRLQDAAHKLLGELNEQLHHSIDTAYDGPDRRKKPRT